MNRKNPLLMVVHNGTFSVHGEVEDPLHIEVKKRFIEYMLDPSSNKELEGMREFAKEHNVPIPTIIGWRKSHALQIMIADAAREAMFSGESTLEWYSEMMKMAMDREVDPGIRARLLTDIMKMDIKRQEILSRFLLDKERARRRQEEKKRDPKELSIEQVVKKNAESTEGSEG